MEKKVFWLYVTVFINILGFGMIFPILPEFGKVFNATGFELGLLAVFFSLGQFIAAPFFGRLSDRFGRKPIILGAVFLSSVSYVIMAFAPILSIVFFARFLLGIASAANFPTATAYIADLTEKNERTKYIAKISAVFSIGFIFGPAFGGILGHLGLMWVFLLSALITLGNFFVVLFFLPESIKKKEEALVIKEGFINIKAMYHGFRGDFGVLFFLLFAWSYYISNFQVAVPLFAAEVLSLNSFDIGIFYSVTGIVSSAAQWFVLPRVTKKFGDLNIIFVALLFMIVGQMLAPFSYTVFLLYGFFTVAIIGSSFIRPTISSVMSKATKEGQGTTMGLAFSFESLGRIVGPLVAGFTIGIFGLTFPFYATVVVLVIGLIFFWLVEMKKPQ